MVKYCDLIKNIQKYTNIWKTIKQEVAVVISAWLDLKRFNVFCYWFSFRFLNMKCLDD